MKGALLGDDADFVVNDGRYHYGSTFAPYAPRKQPSDPLPASVLLRWSFEQAGAPRALSELVRAIQRRTRPNVNAFAVKNLNGRLAWEIYHPLLLSSMVRLYGGERPGMRASELQGSVDFYRAVHADSLGTAFEPVDQAAIALPGPPYVMSFELSEQLLRERHVPGYCLYSLLSAPTVPLALPVRYEGLFWQPGDGALALEQRGVTLEPFAHGPAWLDFIEGAGRELFAEAAPAARELLLPWLIEDTGRFRVGASRKIEKRGVGIYYCGITYPTFVRFLREFAFPEPFVRRVVENASRLEHLVTDVLVSYGLRDGRPVADRASFYGMF